MNEKELMLDLKQKLKEKYFLDFTYTEGDNLEYGKPHSLSYLLGEYILEITSKVANSWCFYNCDGVRILTFSYHRVNYNSYNQTKQKLIDITWNSDLILKWIENCYEKQVMLYNKLIIYPKINEGLDNIKKEVSEGKNTLKTIFADYFNLGKLYKRCANNLYITLKIWKTQYMLLDWDDCINVGIADIKFPYSSNTNASTDIVFQVRMNAAGEISYWYTMKKLTIEKCPQLISILPEIKFNYENTRDVIKNCIKSEVSDIIEQADTLLEKEKYSNLIKTIEGN